MKVKMKSEVLCQDLPIPFKTMFTLVRDMDFEEKPDYDRFRKGIRAFMGPTHGKIVFDWHNPDAKKEMGESGI